MSEKKEFLEYCIYDEKNRLIEQIEKQSQTQLIYNEKDLLIEMLIYKIHENQKNLISKHKYEYNSNNKVIKEETNNYIKIYEYNDLNYPNKETSFSIQYKNKSPALNSSMKYDINGNIIEKQVNNNCWYYEYDKNNNITQMIVEKILKDRYDNSTKKVFEIQTFEYDENNYLLKEILKIDWYETKIEYEYKNNYKEVYKKIIEENLRTELIENINREFLKYDNNKNLIECYYNDELVEKKEYNEKGLLIYDLDYGIDLKKRYEYDDFGNLTLEHDLLLDEQIKYEYDSHNNKIKKETDFYVKYYNNEYKIKEKELLNYFDFDR